MGILAPSKQREKEMVLNKAQEQASLFGIPAEKSEWKRKDNFGTVIWFCKDPMQRFYSPLYLHVYVLCGDCW